MGRLAEAEEAQRRALKNLCYELSELAHRNDAGLDWRRVADALQELDAWDITDDDLCDPIWAAAEKSGEG